MGTRGAYGFRHNDKDTISYNHYDSNPSGLGNKVANFLKEFTNIDDIKKIIGDIKLVQESSKPTEEQKKEVMAFGLCDLDVSSRSSDDWYCLLRNSQGDLSVYTKGLNYMIDGHEFLADSLFCEWAYIINLDTEELEIYRGFNKDANACGRYAYLTRKKEYEYFGVVLERTIPLADFFGKDVDLTYIEEEVEDED